MKKNVEEKTSKKGVNTKKKNSKKIIIPIIIIVGVLLLGVVATLITNNGESGFKLIKPDVKIVKNESSKIEYEKYDNGLISLKIPKGWKVDIPQVDYIHYSFKVCNPENPTYMLLFGLKQEGFLKTEYARSTYEKYYPDAIFSKLTAIDPQTTEGFYNAWNSNVTYSNTNELKYEYFPYLNDLEIVDNLGSTKLGGDILRITYKDANDKLAQGLVTASVMDVGSYYINTDIFNLFSEKVDVFPLNVYNIILMTAPDEEFVNYQSILDYSLSTLEFSQEFLKGFNSEETTLTSTIQANQKVYDEISDMIMDSWEKRNDSYDIISQKQSDATLGYERVYNTDTGEIYKAYNGFTDNYDGTKYKPITDDMYNLPTSGYIEK